MWDRLKINYCDRVHVSEGTYHPVRRCGSLKAMEPLKHREMSYISLWLQHWLDPLINCVSIHCQIQSDLSKPLMCQNTTMQNSSFVLFVGSHQKQLHLFDTAAVPHPITFCLLSGKMT